MYFARADNGRGADIIEMEPAGAPGARWDASPARCAPSDADRGRIGFISILASSDFGCQA